MTNVKAVNVRVVVGDGKEVICKERGDFCVRNKVTNETLLLKNVLYTPTFHKNIISIVVFHTKFVFTITYKSTNADISSLLGKGCIFLAQTTALHQVLTTKVSYLKKI